MNFPIEAKTITHEVVGAGSYSLLPNGEYTILGGSIQQSATNSISLLKCNNEVILRNYGKDFPYNELQYECFGSVIISKTGSDDSSFAITYVPYIVSSSSARFANYIDVASQSALAKGWHDTTFITWLIGIVLCIYVGFKLGTYIYKR